MDGEELDRLVDRADLDALLRAVGQLAAAGDWSGLLDLREACRYALGTGRQLWPAATFAEYRLALDAPGEWAARVLVDGAGQFAPGPLSEVAASSHTWAELAPHVEDGPVRVFVAHERVLRGEDLTGDDSIDRSVLDVPLVLQPWEPAYALPVYEPEQLTADPPDLAALAPVDLPGGAPPAADDSSTVEAWRELVSAWTASSNGRADVAAVHGDHLGAIAALGVTAARVAELSAADAFAWMAWAGASGGAHGRRPGGATGRFGAWWTAVTLAGLQDDWPLPPSEVGALAAELRWWAWDAYEPQLGWQLRLAVWDPADDLAWAIAASDAA